MSTIPTRISLLLFTACSIYAQDTEANSLLRHALRLADLYNWADAAPQFAKAEQMFLAANDQRNALYAKLGRIRSNIERERRALPLISAELGAELETNPLLRNDKQLRMFCLIVKGDIDTETDVPSMREDWQEVQALARDLEDTKWQYRALAQLGLAAFYDGDNETASKNVGTALVAATRGGDAGAQIRYMTALGAGLMESKMYEQALPYFDNALKIANAIPESGYQYLTNEAHLNALIGLKQLDAAQRLADEILVNARRAHRTSHEASALGLTAQIAQFRKDRMRAISALEQTIALCESAGLVRELADAQSLLANIYRGAGDLEKAEELAELAAASTQASGDTWAVPRRLQTVAELQISRGKYTEADRVFDRASVFIDSMIGNVASVLQKTALIKASSDIYAEHFSLVAQRFNDPTKAYGIVEQVRGRITTDLLMAGSVTSDEARKAERAISQLRLKLVATRSTDEIRRIRDQIFLAEQSRWATPDINILKARSQESISLERIQQSLSSSAVILEYVLADPRSYCLVISRRGAQLVSLIGKDRIESLVAAYLKAVKAKQAGDAEARRLYVAVLAPIPEALQKSDLVVIRDGQLHLVPFDGLKEASGRYVAESHTVVYAPSATSFYLLAQGERRAVKSPNGLLAVGGVPYTSSNLNKLNPTDGKNLSDLPASTDEVRAAQASVRDGRNTILLGAAATEAAFKRADLGRYRILHLAVHGFADITHPDRAALILLSDPSAGEDGLLQSSEIVQLKLNAELVILSACDTAIGPLQGQEGIETISRAFLLAGAKTVVSTLWSIDDNVSLALMEHFYKHLAAHQPAAYALTAAKRDLLRQFGGKALPYYWAGFTFEGVADRAIAK